MARSARSSVFSSLLWTLAALLVVREGQCWREDTGPDWEYTITRNTRLDKAISSPQNLSVVSFDWTNCGSDDDLLQIERLDIEPDPISIPGYLTFSVKVTLTGTLRSPLTVDLDVEKKELIWIHIPCIENVGSCTYDDICPMLDNFHCPREVRKYGLTCQCPFRPKNFDVPETTVTLRDMNIPHGDYKVKVTMTTGDQEVMCLRATFSIQRME